MIDDLEICDLLLDLEFQYSQKKSINIETCRECGEDFNSYRKGTDLYCPGCLSKELKTRTVKADISQLVKLLDQRRYITSQVEVIKNNMLNRFQKEA